MEMRQKQGGQGSLKGGCGKEGSALPKRERALLFIIG